MSKQIDTQKKNQRTNIQEETGGETDRERRRETGSNKKREKNRVKYQGQETVTERLREINDKESSLLFAYYNDNCSNDNCS